MSISNGFYALFNKQHGVCAACGKALTRTSQIAHRVPQRKWVLAKYGADVVHNQRNIGLVCNLSCNAKIALDPASLEAKKLMEEIINERDDKGAGRYCQEDRN